MTTADSGSGSGGHFFRLDERPVHQGHIWHVVVANFVGPDGQGFERDIVRSPGSVGVVPLFETPSGFDVVMVRQYRAAFERELWEIPAGMRDVPGEPPELTAARELAEEVGLVAGSLEPLTPFMPSPGMTDAVAHLFLATDLTEVPRDLHGPEEEHMQVVRLPLAEALAMVDRGEIDNAMAVIGLLMTDRRLAAR
jgi:8-oxo-dGTP pyrophosphatase MutT (NUDIX family)